MRQFVLRSLPDINECYENPSICPANAICTNLPGSYKCECGPGFEPDSSGSGCVTEDFCGTGKNDCDRTFATCLLVPGSFKCECLQGFRGAGTVNTCERRLALGSFFFRPGNLVC